MTRTKLIDGIEQDAVSGWRHVIKFRPGQRAYAKRKIRRRARTEGREEIRKEDIFHDIESISSSQ